MSGLEVAQVAALVEFAVLRNIGQVRSKVRPLNFRKADFQLLREIVRKIP